MSFWDKFDRIFKDMDDMFKEMPEIENFTKQTVYTKRTVNGQVVEDSKKEGKVTRFEVIDHSSTGEGRAFVKYNIAVKLSYQDDGRTLKVFVTDPEKDKDASS
jgi:hypothetical protein